MISLRRKPLYNFGTAVLYLMTWVTLESAPLVHVAQTREALKLDGKGNGSTWESAIAVSDFLTPDSDRPLQEKTEVRLLWDNKKLYVRARLEESILLTASQQQHEIRANIKERDGNIIQDDSFLLILHPENSNDAFEFAVNTLGVLADAKSNPADPWRTRDFSWNANVEVAVTLGDGFWTVEMAIPWSELGVGAPEEGAQWQAILGRHAAVRRESGAWNLSRGGIHSPVEWGKLKFGAAAAGLQIAEPITRLEVGPNKLQLRLTPQGEADNNLLITTKITPDQANAHPIRTRENTTLPDTQPTTVQHQFEVPTTGGTARFSWSVLNASNLEPLYQSPEMAMEVLTSSVQLQFSTDASWRLIVNDISIASGERAENETIRIPIRMGANVLALEAQSGSAKIRLSSPDLGSAPIRWKMRPAQDTSASKAKADDSSWATAPESEGGEVGTGNTPTVFRHTILLQDTRIFPTPIPALYIAGSGVQPLTFTAFGTPEKILKEWKTVLELPPSVEAIAATGYYGNTREKPRFSLRSDEAPIYVVEADAPITERRPGHPILSIFQVALRQKMPQQQPSEQSYVMRHYSRANENTVSELAQTTPLRLLPPLKGKQPQKLSLQIWGSYFTNMDNPEVRNAIAETAQTAGFNEFVGAPGDQAHPFSLHSVLLVTFKSWSLNLNSWLREHPQARLINQKGQPDDTLMCTTILLESGWKEAGAPLLKAWQEDRKVDVISYDYEYPPFTGPHSCYCPRCLEEFRKAAGLAKDTFLNPETISTHHRAAWIDFMARRAARLFKLMKGTVHELPGNVKFEVYSGYQTPDNAARYGVDWRYVGELQAVDRAAMGYGRPVPAIDETIKSLRGIPAIFGQLITPYMKQSLDFSRPTTQVTKAHLLRRFIDGTGGALVYHTQNMDGRSWLAAAETSRLVAKFEDLFGTLRAKALPGHPEDEVSLLQSNSTSLLVVMNHGRAEKTYSFDLPELWNTATEFYSGNSYHAGKRIEITLPPGEAAAFHNTPKN